MAYITNYNFRRITKGFEIPKNKDYKFDDTVIWISPDGIVYDQDNPSRLFARWDVNDLLLFKAFCKDTALAAGNFYRKLPKPQDSYQYIQPEKAPSYHNDPNCLALHSEFESIAIPEEIREQGKEKVIAFRKWWNEHEDLRLENPKAFVARINLAFHINIREFEVETKSNSGIREIDNITIAQINEAINKKFKDLFSWAKEEKKREIIFNTFAYLSYLGDKKDKQISNNPTQYSDDEIKEVLRYVHPRKMGIIQDLQNLYLKTYNPDLSFKSTLLEQLGFEPCYQCCYVTTEDIDLSDFD